MEQIKKQLEHDLLITKWNPTDAQLVKISKKISELKNPTKNDISKIIYEIYGSFECMMLESIDNSDLTTLLKLATYNGKDNDK